MYTGIRLLLLICPFISSFFLSLQFSNIKIFRHIFLRNCEAQKTETWYTRGQMYRVYRNQAVFIRPFVSSFFFVSNFQTSVSGTVRSRTLKLCTHINCGQIYRVYRDQAAAAYSSFYLSFFFLSNVQTLNVLLHFSQEL